MQSIETKSSRPKSFETETRPEIFETDTDLKKRVSRHVSMPRPSLETPSLVRDCPVQHSSEVCGLGTKEQSFVVVVDFQLTFIFLVVKVKTVNTAFVVLSFNFHIWKYSPTVAMSLLYTPSTVCQSPSACMIARSLAYAQSAFWRRWLAGQRCRC